jgi:hypothetical protein
VDDAGGDDGRPEAAHPHSQVAALRAAIRNRAGWTHATSRIYAMAGDYLTTWALFSVGATALQRWFAPLFAAEKSSSWRNTQ